MTIFISKDEQDLGTIPLFLKGMGVNLIHRSLIKFEKVFFEFPSDFEVVFFPSIRAAQFILESNELNIDSYVLACSGSQTNERLEDLGHSCQFIGKNAGSPDQVSRDFSSWLGNRRVFIPHSNRSVLSITSHIPNQQVVRSVVYNTILSDAIIEWSDIYVFSSPSNIDSFFKKNKLKKDSLVIVWGQTSAMSLLNYGKRADFILQYGTLQELQSLFDELIESSKTMDSLK